MSSGLKINDSLVSSFQVGTGQNLTSGYCFLKKNQNLILKPPIKHIHTFRFPEDKVLPWRLSNTLNVGFCVDGLQEALWRFEVPEIFNTSQGAQFTRYAFIDALKAYPIRVSVDSETIPFSA